MRYVSLGDVKARNLKGMYPILVPNGKNLLILSFYVSADTYRFPMAWARARGTTRMS